MSDAVSLRGTRGLCEVMRRRASSPSNADVRDGLGAAAAVMSVIGFCSVFSSSDVEEEDAAYGVSS